MPILLVSLGTSPAIVPEAFLLPGVEFRAVHVLTTDSTPVGFVAEWFTERAPGVELTITRVSGFTDFRSEDDHFHFEEVLYRWWQEMSRGERPYVCLSGGFKTMSAAMQKAAAVFGAVEVFHVLCDLPQAQQPNTVETIEAARTGGNLHWIRLGAESGWPQLAGGAPVGGPLEETGRDGIVRWVQASDSLFRDHLQHLLERNRNIAGAWDRLHTLPFAELATWPAAQLAWLDGALDPASDRGWIEALPKVELHCHLGGFATHGELLAQVRAAAQEPSALPAMLEQALPTGWPQPGSPVALDRYMKLGDANGSKLLRDPGCLRKQCQLLYAHLRQQNVIYAEIRCSPNNYSRPGRSAWDVLGEIRGAFQQCMEEEPGCHVNLLVIATRKDGGDRSDISRHLALAITAAQHWADEGGCRVVGVDLAGFENRETRAALFATDFEPVHRVGLAVTVHAGENDDAEGIWQAVFKLNTRRIGHALHLIDAPDLMRAVADRRIGLEMCPYANLQIKGYSASVRPDGTGLTNYPLKTYLDAGIAVTVNTDNIGISAASLSDNFLLLASLCPGISRLDILRIVRNGIDQSFLPDSARQRLLERNQTPPPS
jgi:adenosine deaminase